MVEGGYYIVAFSVRLTGPFYVLYSMNLQSSRVLSFGMMAIVLTCALYTFMTW